MSTIQLIVEAVDQSPIFERKSQTVVLINFGENKFDEILPKKLVFNPLPKIVFISTSKPIRSIILKYVNLEWGAKKIFL